MVGTRTKAAAAGALILLAAGATGANALGGGVATASLNSFNETPLTLSTGGTGTFRATLSANRINFTLRYSGLRTPVAAAHIHLGRTATTGGVAAFLCEDGPPASTPNCPDGRGTVTGVIRAAQVVGPADQGIAAGRFNALLRAIRAGATYVNVHTMRFPSGEIRGALR